MNSFFNFIINTLSPIVGILTAIPVFMLWYDLSWGRRKQHKIWMEKAATTPGRISAILIVDLFANGDITAAVKHFKAGDEKLKSISDENIVTVSRIGDLKPKDIAELVRDIQDKVAEVLNRGVDELNVFFAGPVCVASMLGAELSNVSCKVLLYQNDRATSSYVNFGPLRHPRF